MPITRREDEIIDPIDSHILTLWNNKWLLLAVGVLTAVITYGILLFVPETYRVKSEIFVNRLSPAAEEETPNPETVTSLLKSQAVLEKVRNDFAQKFQLNPPPKIEEFAKAFNVKSTILQDTTVQKQYSPVLSLEVESIGSKETRYIMESWIRIFISEFGNYTTQEAVYKREAFLKEKANLEKEIVKLEVQRSVSDAKLPFLKRMLAEKLDLLTPSRLQFVEQDVDTMKLDFSIQNPRMRSGLMERYSQLKLDMAAGNAPTTAPLELAALETAINEAHTSITDAEKNLADARYEQLQVVRHLQQMVANQTAMNDAVTKFTVAAAIYKKTSEGLPAGGDIRALSTPITPESRVWPKRTLTAVLVAIVAVILTALWLFARNFLTRLSAAAIK